MFTKKTISLLAAVLIPFAAGAAETVTINGHKAYTGRVLARFKDQAGAGADLRALSVPGGRIEHASRTVPGLVVIEREGAELQGLAGERKAESLENWIAALEATGLYEYVEPDYQISHFRVPADRAFVDGTLWALNNYGQGGGVTGADISATNAWDLTVGSTNVVVGVIDSGIRYTHQDLVNNMWVNPGEIPANGSDDDNDGYIDNVYGIDALNNDGDPMDDNDHGTHVAGTIGATANDGNPHVGVAWEVRLMALKFLGADGFGPTSGAIECIDFAVSKGVKILNNSWGGGGFSQALFDSILAARNAGVLFVAAAGNDFNDNDRFPVYPASYQLDNIITVAATDRADRLAQFSNYGRNSVDLAAPGVAIYSSVSDSDTAYEFFDGTSMAAPHVAGVAALIAAYSPAATYTDIISRITNGVDRLTVLEPRTITGGRLNAINALTRGIDGVLEVNIRPAPDSLLTIGTNVDFFVTVTDGIAVTNATVTISGGGTNLTFVNRGVDPDQIAEDEVYSARYLVPNTPGPIDFTLRVSAPGKTNFTQMVTFTAVERPENDLFERATKVPPEGGEFSQSVAFATLELGEPAHAGTNVLSSVWYTWSLSTNANVIIDTAGSTYTPILAVYTNSVLNNLFEIVSDKGRTNQFERERDAFVQFEAQANVAYKIAVASANPNDTSPFLNIRFEINGEPDTRAPFVTVTHPPVSGITVRTNRIHLAGIAADREPDATGVQEVQIRHQRLGIGEDRGVVDTFIFLEPGQTNWVDEAGSALGFGLNRFVVVAFDQAENRSEPVTVDVFYRLEESSGDFFALALPLMPPSGVVSNETTEATREFEEPAHAGNVGGRSVWYQFTPETDGILFLSTAGSSFDTLLGVYTGPRVNALTELAASDDLPGGSNHSEVTIGVRADQTYYIAVDGYDGEFGTAELTYSFRESETFRLTVEDAPGGTVVPGSGLFPMNATLSVRAIPEEGFQFREFQTPNGVVTENPYTFVIQGDTRIIPSFEPRQYSDDFAGGFDLPFEANGWTITADPDDPANTVAGAVDTAHGKTSTLVLVTNLLGGFGGFDVRVSSEANFDELKFLVNGEVRRTWSGEVPWTTFEFEVPQGEARLEWHYKKDIGFTAGLDAAFIDNLELPIGDVPAAPPSVSISEAGSAVRIRISTAPGRSVTLESSPDLQEWSTAAELTADAAGAAVFTSEAGGDARFYRVRLP